MLNVSKTEEISEKCPKNSLIFYKIRNKTTNYTNFAIKRERSQAGLMTAEREQNQDRDSGVNYTNETNYQGTMTVEQYDQFREVIRKKGYKQYNHPGTIQNESWYFYKGFAHTEDEDGESSPGYQVIFLVWDRRNHRVEIPVPQEDTMGVTPLILTSNHEYERIDLEITDDKVMDVDNVEQFAHDFYFNFLLVHNL